MTPKRIKEIINMIPKELNPRIGGSYNLYLRGLKDSYRDIDIIVDSVEGIDLPFCKIEVWRKKRLSQTLKYCIDGREVDFCETIIKDNPSIEYNPIMDLNFVGLEETLKAKEIIDIFIKENYG